MCWCPFNSALIIFFKRKRSLAFNKASALERTGICWLTYSFIQPLLSTQAIPFLIWPASSFDYMHSASSTVKWRIICRVSPKKQCRAKNEVWIVQTSDDREHSVHIPQRLSTVSHFKSWKCGLWYKKNCNHDIRRKGEIILLSEITHIKKDK